MKQNSYLAPFVRSFFEDHLKCQRNLAANSVWSYRDAIKLFIQFLTNKYRKKPSMLLVTDINEEIVLEFLNHLETDRGNSIQTRNHRLTALRCLFEYVSLREPLLFDHARKIAAIPLKRGAVLKPVRYLGKDEVHAMFASADPSTDLGRRDQMLLMFMYNTGARVQEVADVTVSRISLSFPYKVELLGKGRKWRTCPLWETTTGLIKKYIDKHGKPIMQNEPLFVNRSGYSITPSGIAYIIHTYAEKASRTMPSLKNLRITPHLFRHTTALHLLQSGVELNVIKSWLGHASITTTNRYLQIDLTMKEEALKKCEFDSQRPTEKRWRSNPELLDWLESL